MKHLFGIRTKQLKLKTIHRHFSEVLQVVTVFITGTKVFISTITLYAYNHLNIWALCLDLLFPVQLVGCGFWSYFCFLEVYCVAAVHYSGDYPTKM